MNLLLRWCIEKVLKILQKWRIAAMAFYPFIFYAKKEYKNKNILLYKYLYNHEKIHHPQQIELIHIIFLLIYYGQYFYFRLFLRYDHRKAYKSICFEREASQNERDLNYLKKRKPYSWFKYINQNK